MIIITGGAGFIGSNVVAGLQERGRTDLVVCDRLGSGEKWRNLARRELLQLVPPPELFFYLEDHGDEVEAVIHMGAITSTTEDDADLLIENNFRFSVELWDWCTRWEAPFIYASSAATYGDGSRGFDDDRDADGLTELEPLTPYAWSKHLFDRRTLRRVEEGRPAPPQWVGLKFFNVYGPNEHHKGDMRSLVAKAYPTAAAGEAVALFASDHPDYPDGGQKRDFTWVLDCVDVVLWLLEHPEVCGLFNVGTGEARSWRELAEALFGAVGREARVEYVEMPEKLRGSYQSFTEARIDRLRAAGYTKDFRSLEEGVEAYVREYLATDDPYR